MTQPPARRYPARVDAALDSTGDIAAGFPRLTDPLAAVAQRIRMRVERHYNDWPFDLDAGLRYADWRQQKPPDPDAIGALIREEISGTPGVLRIDDWTSTWGRDARRLSFGGTVVAQDGTIEFQIAAVGGDIANHFPALTLYPSAVPIAPGL